MANALLAQNQQPPLFCPPTTLTLTPAQVRAAMERRLRDHNWLMPERQREQYLAMPVAAEAPWSLREVYPCERAP